MATTHRYYLITSEKLKYINEAETKLSALHDQLMDFKRHHEELIEEEYFDRALDRLFLDVFSYLEFKCEECTFMGLQDGSHFTWNFEPEELATLAQNKVIIRDTDVGEIVPLQTFQTMISRSSCDVNLDDPCEWC